MPKTKLNIIKPALGVNQMPDGDLLARLNAVHDGMLNNPAYPNPPVDMAAFKAANDAYMAAAAAALDGGKSAITERDKRRADAVILLRLPGHYVEVECKGDPPTSVSSGFVAATRQRTPSQPVSIPSIVKIDQGTTGQLLVTIQSVNSRFDSSCDPRRFAPPSPRGRGTDAQFVHVVGRRHSAQARLSAKLEHWLGQDIVDRDRASVSHTYQVMTG